MSSYKRKGWGISDQEFFRLETEVPREVEDSTEILKTKLPLDFIEKRKGTSYLPFELFAEIKKYFGGFKIFDLVKSSISEYEKEFEEKYRLATDKQLCIKNEKNELIQKYEYEFIKDWEYTSVIDLISYRNFLEEGRTFVKVGNNLNAGKLLDELFNNYAKNEAGLDAEERTNCAFYSVSEVVLRFDIVLSGIKYSRIIDFLESNYEKTDLTKDHTQKLKWKGKPAHLALIVDLLIEKGYLEATRYGERTAEILLNMFDFEHHKPTKESLGRILHKDTYPINDKTAVDMFNRMPSLKDLK